MTAQTGWLDALKIQLQTGAPACAAMVRGGLPLDPGIVLATAEAVGVFQGARWGDEVDPFVATAKEDLEGSKALTTAVAALDLSPEAIDLDHAEDDDDQDERLASLVALGAAHAAFPADTGPLQRAVERNSAVAWMKPATVASLAEEAGFFADAIDAHEGPLSELLDAIAQAPSAIGAALPGSVVTAGRERARQRLFPRPFVAWARAHGAPELCATAERAAGMRRLAADSGDDAPSFLFFSLGVKRHTDEQVGLMFFGGDEEPVLAWSGDIEPPVAAYLLPQERRLERASVGVDDVEAWALEGLPEGPFAVRLTWSSGERWEIHVPVA